MAGCDYPGCEEAGLLFTCKYCGQRFCGKHRLPENHDCIGLEFFKTDEYRRAKIQKFKKTGGVNQTVVRKYESTSGLLPRKPRGFFDLFTFGSEKKNLQVGVLLAAVSSGMLLLFINRLQATDLLGMFLSLVFPLVIGGFMLLTRYYLLRKAIVNVGGGFHYGHTWLGIVATIVTNLFYTIIRWISFGWIIIVPPPADSKKGAHVIYGIVAYSIGLAFLFKTITIILAWIPNTQGTLMTIINYFSISLYTGGSALIIYTIIALIPMGPTEGNVVKTHDMTNLILTIVLAVLAFFAYVSFSLNWLTLLLLSGLLIVYGLFETLISPRALQQFY